MFISIKEKLITIKNNESNSTHTLISEYLLDCLEKHTTPRAKKCAEYAYCSESVVTAFSKKYGYDGFKELAVRIKVECEYYSYKDKKYDEHSEDNYRTIINTSLDTIDIQENNINKLVDGVNSAEKVVVISCYQQYFNSELFTSELQLSGVNAQINYQRKLNPALWNVIKNNDLFIFIVFGLDNQYLVNYYNLIKQKTNNIVVICSRSQNYKFSDTKVTIIVDSLRRNSILESTRSVLLMYLFSKIIYKIRMLVQK